jgi:hypothetical protein
LLPLDGADQPGGKRLDTVDDPLQSQGLLAPTGPAKRRYCSQTASLASTATTTTFSHPVSVTVSVPSANALVEIYARVRLKTSNGQIR